jgi:O-antigen/teichoic acid export membrane protein
MAQQYLWCTERARLACIPIVVGLSASLLLNAFLLPRFGIEGAAVSAAIANFAALTASLALAQMLGLRNAAGIATFVLWPGVLMFGLWSAVTLAAVPLFGGLGLLLLLDSQEKGTLWALFHRIRSRIARRSHAFSGNGDGQKD